MRSGGDLEELCLRGVALDSIVYVRAGGTLADILPLIGGVWLVMRALGRQLLLMPEEKGYFVFCCDYVLLDG